MKVFISYSWDDAAIRRALVSDLGRMPDLEILYDRAYLRASDQIHPGISKLLDDADLIVAILTNRSLSSHEVLDELSRANDRKKQIISLVHESINEPFRIPHYLRDSLQISFGDRTIDQALDQLIAELKIANAQHRQSVEQLRFTTCPSFAPTTVTDFDLFDIHWLQRSNLGRELLEQVIAMCRVFQFSVDIPDRHLQVPLLVSPNTFLPDNWTRTFLEGLAVLPTDTIKDMTVVEIGVGTGVIPVALNLLGRSFRKFFGYDIDTLAARVALLNVEFYGLSDRVSIRGGGSIFEPERGLVDNSKPYADVVLANVPQVPSLSTGPIRDQFDYYYMPASLRGEDEVWAMQGLWLVAGILRQAKDRLKPGGSVIVNVGGRPTLQHILAMFAALGYTPAVVHRRRIEQDKETDISALSYFERSRGIHYEFYTDKQRDAKVSATIAYDRIASGKPCFHDIFVIRGTLEGIAVANEEES